MFKRHHYLSGELPRGCVCYGAFWGEAAVALCAVASLYGQKGRRRIARVVTLPDYQGIGIGSRVLDEVARLTRAQGHRVCITAGHPSVLSHCRRSARWRLSHFSKTGYARGWVDRRRKRDPKTASNAGGAAHNPWAVSSLGRSVASFEYVGEDRGFTNEHE